MTTEHLPFANSDKALHGQLADVPNTSLLPEGEKKPAIELMNRVVRGAHDTIDRLAENAAPQVQRLGDGVAGASETLHANADRLRETRDEWTASLRNTVRENPLATVLAALALGALIARVSR
ncbi:hypothetical protein [Paucibacter soli]|uniref:hypothetical protein n=1 Tax=Paucibacter soli TaxID=3133433 RepID=UPI0030ADE502